MFDGTVITASVSKGAVRTTSKRVKVPLNSKVRLVVSGDVRDEVHVHGVDEYVDLTPGETSTHDFVARVPGTFEIELHDAGTLLLTLQVQP